MKALQPGETFTWTAKRADGTVGTTFNLTRTTRPYAYDLADAYNAASTRTDTEWIVTLTGELKMIERQDWSVAYAKAGKANAERDRADWKHRQTYPVTADAA